ncbi:MAG: hypothetical protein ABI467_22140 [Kofleriaceae bacterium]
MTLRSTLPHVARLALLLGATSCTGPSYDSSTPFVTDTPEVYVAKVKNILVGLPPTDDEIAAVDADPDALPQLIDTWMALPQYQQKMMVFFELAFQQTQITDANFIDIAPPNGLPNSKQTALLVQNSRESFARTVLDLTAKGQPLTDGFKTKHLMMTPALMQLYAYFEAHQANDAGAITDTFAKANPTLTFTMESAAGAIPIASTLTVGGPNYMHWYNPDVATQTYPDPTCNGVDPITITVSSDQLYRLIYGQIPAHKVGTVACPVRGGTGMGTQLLATDFTDWKMVTIRPPNAGEQPTAFYDLPTLRTATELVVRTPRPGFFSTPAFFANWPTNSSNQMRVTLNQALIVATGMQIDGSDGTQPGMTPGLDPAHAGPGTACFGCHQLLDPTRSILSSTYSWFYNQQTDPLLTKQPGLFAFQHVIAPMSTIDDFANLLATHPLVPGAWAQKLCYYANSAPCDPSDPEFQRIVADFSADGLQWNALVKELLSSPITTNVTETKTYATNSEVIAVSRRDHLCAQLDNRLGFVDICQLDESSQVGAKTAIAQIVSGMPSDGYGRGGVIPVLPNQPTLFYRGGLENICVQVAAQVIDAKANPKQPGAKMWSSSQPAAAITELVSLVMGLTSHDPRTADVTAALTAHFAAAKTSGASATDALRSTFVAACLSPSFIGIGM